MKIVNGTTHEINIYSVQDCYPIEGGRKLVKKPGAVPVHVVQPGTNLNAVKDNLPAPASWRGPFPLKGGVVFLGYDPIPEGDIVVVSNMYRSAVRELGGDTSRLATVDGAVYEDESAIRPCGCTGLAVG